MFDVPPGGTRLEIHFHAKTDLSSLDPRATIRLRSNPQDEPQTYNGVATRQTSSGLVFIGENGHGLTDLTVTSIGSDTSGACWIPAYTRISLKKDIRCAAWSVVGFGAAQHGTVDSGGVRTGTNDAIHTIELRLDTPNDPDIFFWVGSVFRLEVH